MLRFGCVLDSQRKRKAMLVGPVKSPQYSSPLAKVPLHGRLGGHMAIRFVKEVMRWSRGEVIDLTDEGPANASFKKVAVFRISKTKQRHCKLIDISVTVQMLSNAFKCFRD
jgi:hypothetical protein